MLSRDLAQTVAVGGEGMTGPKRLPAAPGSLTSVGLGNGLLAKRSRELSAKAQAHKPQPRATQRASTASEAKPPRRLHRAASLTARRPLRPPWACAAPGAEHAGTCSHRAPVAADRLGACADAARLCKVAASGWARTGCHLGRATEELLRRRVR